MFVSVAEQLGFLLGACLASQGTSKRNLQDILSLVQHINCDVSQFDSGGHNALHSRSLSLMKMKTLPAVPNDWTGLSRATVSNCIVRHPYQFNQGIPAREPSSVSKAHENAMRRRAS